MARKPVTTKEVPGTEIVDWEKQMAEQAELAANAQRTMGAGGKFFSLKSGVLSYDGNPLPGNQAAVVIMGDIMENSYYSDAYDPDTPASPRCFAFNKVEADLEPHVAVDNDTYFERQNAVCNGCPQNEWGSAPTGKGKACKNVMRIALLSAGVYKPQGKGRNVALELEVYDDPEHYAKSEIAYLKLSVMNVKHYATFVKQIAADMRRPPHGVIVNMFVEPDPKSQFRVNFELIDAVPKELLQVVMHRHTKEQAAIDFPYSPPMLAEEATPTKANNKLTKKPAAKVPAKARR